MSGERYTHGHHESVLRSHRWRTAENSAAYLLERLRSGQRVLDLGCGPGTITLDLARRVAPGEVVGVDTDAGVLDGARCLARESGLSNVTFQTQDAYSLEFDGGTFDVVHAHQVLQHLAAPVRALEEARRVLRPGGLLAVRDADYSGMVWAPRDPRLDSWLTLYKAVVRRHGGEPDAARFLPAWTRRAGFSAISATSSTWTFAEPESTAWWGELWADRVRVSALARAAVDYGLATAEDLEDIASGWLEWARHPDAIFIVVNGEILATAGDGRPSG